MIADRKYRTVSLDLSSFAKTYATSSTLQRGRILWTPVSVSQIMPGLPELLLMMLVLMPMIADKWHQRHQSNSRSLRFLSLQMKMKSTLVILHGGDISLQDMSSTGPQAWRCFRILRIRIRLLRLEACCLTGSLPHDDPNSVMNLRRVDVLSDKTSGRIKDSPYTKLDPQCKPVL